MKVKFYTYETIVDRIIHNSVVIETGETNMRQILKC